MRRSAGAVPGSPVGCLGDGDPLALQVLAQTVVQLRQAPQLKVRHGLLVLLDLRRVAHVSRGVLRHVAGRMRGSGVASVARIEPGRVMGRVMGRWRRCWNS